jgi:large subunit ribosomal protein L22
MKATASQLRITPRKINLIADLVRNKDVNDALVILHFTPKKGARLLYKIIKSAVANAENNFKQDKDTLYVKEIVVGKAMTLKRSVPISRGRVHPILKRSAHVHVTIGVREGAEKNSTKATAKIAKTTGTQEKSVKVEKKETVKTAKPTKSVKPATAKVKKVKA